MNTHTNYKTLKFPKGIDPLDPNILKWNRLRLCMKMVHFEGKCTGLQCKFCVLDIRNADYFREFINLSLKERIALSL